MSHEAACPQCRTEFMGMSENNRRNRHHPPGEANEFFYIDKDGKKSDRAIHEAILNGLSKEGAERLRQAAYARGRARGWSEEEIRKSYGNHGDPWE
jgi:hypothetical protein